jgi:dihydropyrimidinase
MFDLVVKGGTVVTSRHCFRADVAICGESIAAVGEGLEGRRVLDAEDRLVLPGCIDAHVHLDLPVGKFRSSDDFASGTRAALCGGVTTLVDFTVGSAETTLAEDIRVRLEAARASVTDYALHGEIVGWQRSRAGEIREALEMGVRSFKFFTAYGASGRRTDRGRLLDAFGVLSGVNALALVHAEDEEIVTSLQEELSPEEEGCMVSLARTRPASCEAAAIHDVAWIAARTGTRVHIVHVSSRDGVEEVRQARRRGVSLTAETCPQYLLLTEKVYATEEGHLYSAAPALRTAMDREALWKALASGELDMVATDHCPFTREQKCWKGSFRNLPYGLPGVETLLPLLHSEGVVKGHLSLPALVRLLAEAPARINGLYPHKGSLLPGADADLVVLDPHETWTLSAKTLHMRTDFSPYEGLAVTGKVCATLSRGELVFADGTFLGHAGRGRFLAVRF